MEILFESVFEIVFRILFEFLALLGTTRYENKKYKLVRYKVLRNLRNIAVKQYLFNLENGIKIEIIKDVDVLYLFRYVLKRNKKEYFEPIIITDAPLEHPLNKYVIDFTKSNHFRVLKSLKGCLDLFFSNNSSLRFTKLTNDEIILLETLFQQSNKT